MRAAGPSLTVIPTVPGVRTFRREDRRKNCYRQSGCTQQPIRWQIHLFPRKSSYYIIPLSFPNTHKNVNAFSTSYGNRLRPWPVQLMWTSRHWQSGAVNEHANAEMHCKRSETPQRRWKPIFPKNLTAVIFVVPSQIAIDLVVAHQRPAYARSPMTFEFVFGTFVILWTVHTVHDDDPHE